ncbi:MAG TPA: amidohydrolase [Bryobacteraceae bacterium]|nr:amidohydrolase [Bryobacteraceae bacterium]
MRFCRSACILISILSSTVIAGAQQRASLVLVDGNIWTGNPAQPEAEAVAVAGDRILAVGSSGEMLKLATPDARIVHLHGRRVVPGFNDSHVHVTVGGQDELGVHLTDTHSPAEFRQRIADYAKTVPQGKWILSGLWDEQRWTPVVLPTHELIDDVTPNNPVAVMRTDLHMLLANAVAMKLAGVDRNTKDIPGGVIGRDRNGDPTGIFKDAGKELILRAIPAQTETDVEKDFLVAEKIAARNGVTSIQDMAVSDTDAIAPLRVQALQSLDCQGRLTFRVAENMPLMDGRQMEELGIRANFGNLHFHIGGLKSFADGGLGASTAWFVQPYTNSPSNYGTPTDQMQHPEQMFEQMKRADQAGLQLITHAIGDRANHVMLDMYERLEKEDGPRDRRLRIEHAQTLLPSDIPRFAKLHVVASVQPYHAIDDGRWAESRIGPVRIRTTYAFRSLIDSGATLAFGSDWPVAPLAPLIGIYAAATRRTIDGKNPNGWMPQEKISVEQALRAYTVNAAYAEGEEREKGELKPGQLADIVVLAQDILRINPVEIQNTKVDYTIFDGKVIYDRTSPSN